MHRLTKICAISISCAVPLVGCITVNGDITGINGNVGVGLPNSTPTPGVTITGHITTGIGLDLLKVTAQLGGTGATGLPPSTSSIRTDGSYKLYSQRSVGCAVFFWYESTNPDGSLTNAVLLKDGGVQTGLDFDQALQLSYPYAVAIKPAYVGPLNLSSSDIGKTVVAPDITLTRNPATDCTYSPTPAPLAGPPQ